MQKGSITIAITVKDGKAITFFTGLSVSTKYYIAFEIPAIGNMYSFNGTISKY